MKIPAVLRTTGASRRCFPAWRRWLRCEWLANAAFSRVDLGAVLGTLGLIVLVVLPALASSRAPDGRMVCLNNLKRIMTASNLYAADNSDSLPHTSWGIDMRGPGNWAYATADKGRLPGEWLFPYSLAGRIDNSPQLPWRRIGQLWPYLRDASPYECPDDLVRQDPNSRLYIDRPVKVTSYSMNGAIISYGTLPGVQTHPLASFSPDALLIWDNNEMQPFYFNDAASYPRLDSVSGRHGRRQVARQETTTPFGGAFNAGRADGGAEYMTRKIFAELTKWPPDQRNRVWCDPTSPTGSR